RQQASTPQQRAGKVLGRLAELFEIGRQAGTNRPGLGEGEQRAHDLVASWMAEAGLGVEVDPAGNLIGRLPGSDPSAAEVWTGSHLDTPPDGGMFDGALGVVAGLDAAAAIGAGSVRRTIAVVAFRLEEGCRFGRGVFGSRAMVGDIEPDEGDLLDADGISVADAFAELGLGRLPTRGWADPPPACFLETHIEQGPALASAGAPLGVVTSIAGMAGFDVVFSGSRGHAGTVPMSLRSDALGAASRFVLAAHEVARSIPGSVATIGRLVALPGATNTIPGRAELFADLRAPDAERLDALVERVTAAAAEAAVAGACTAEAVLRWRYQPVAMDPATAAAVRRAVAGLGLDPVDLPSGAGHDAAIMATAGIPSAMLFVRSDAGGVSHAPEESTGADAIALNVQALESALRELAA
ncbi:MAG: Zn-dependent hydrolase, partial [Gaiellales bacterium]